MSEETCVKNPRRSEMTRLDALSVLTCVSRQRVVRGASTGGSEAFGRLSSSSGSAWAFRRFDFSAEFGSNDSQQDDGGGLLPTLLIGVGDLLGIRGKVGQTAWKTNRKLFLKITMFKAVIHLDYWTTELELDDPKTPDGSLLSMRASCRFIYIAHFL